MAGKPSCHLSVPSLLAAAGALKGILESIDAERAKVLNASRKKLEEEEGRNKKCGFGGTEDERRRFVASEVAKPVETPASQQALALPQEGRSHVRRPGRLFRKRERRPFPEEYCGAKKTSNAGVLNRERLQLLTAASLRGEALATGTSYNEPGNGTTAADQLGRPWSSMEQQKRQQRQLEHQRGSAALDAAGRFAGGAAPSSSLIPCHLQRQPRPCYFAANATTRTITSETYLRRLFVTASLAHVLSLDKYLPRSMAAKRAASARGARGSRDGTAVADGDDVSGGVPFERERGNPPLGSGVGGSRDGRGSIRRGKESGNPARDGDDDDSRERVWYGREPRGGSEGAREEQVDPLRGGSEGAGKEQRDPLGGTERERKLGGNHIEGRRDNGGRIDNINNSSKYSIEITNQNPPSSHHGDNTGPFKKRFPVTLVDSAGRRWSMTYETTRRDNLHSGRLIDGWESFCCANGLRVGDQVEFTKLEEPDYEGGGHKGRGAVASVAAYRKHARFREFGV